MDMVTAALLVVCVVFVPVSAWVAAAMVSTASILNGPPAVAHPRLWLLIVWTIPLVGAGAWWLYLRRIKFT
ncbi:hypothetical protein [Williamsia muralis]|uniref:hypothetical protein n=1 Tax=Williamsia marianensis TaxID=85044 RepID=UPI0038105B9E